MLGFLPVCPYELARESGWRYEFLFTPMSHTFRIA